MEEMGSKPLEDASDTKSVLRWYQFRLSSLMWLTLIVALLVTSVIMQRKITKYEQRLEEIKQNGATREVTPGYITQVGFGPGWIFRGELPKGKWRLAVYFWKENLKGIYSTEPPPDLAPLVAEPLPSYKDVNLEVSEAELPRNTIRDGKIVTTVYNFKVWDTRPGHLANRYSTEPVLLSSAFGSTSFHPQTMQLPGKRNIELWDKEGNQDGNHLLLQLEPIDDKSIPPQIGKERHFDFRDTTEE
jgi:hypothetical protein